MPDSKQSTGSPWEDVLEEPKKEKPKVFGSLDNIKNSAPTTNGNMKLSVPDTMPKAIGNKVSAKEALNNQPSNMEEIKTTPQSINVPSASPAPNPAPLPVEPKPEPLPPLPTPKPAPPPYVAPIEPKPIIPTPAPVKMQSSWPTTPPPPSTPKPVPPPLTPPPAPKPDPQPVVPPVEPKPIIPTPAPVETKPEPIKVPEPPVTSSPSPGIRNRFADLFSKKATESPRSLPITSNEPKPEVITPPLNNTSPEIKAQPKPIFPSPTAPEEPKKPVFPENEQKTKKPKSFSSINKILFAPKALIVEILLLLIFGLVYFNEAGILSTGAEKVYGIFHLEALWGGLPADPQMALGQSFKKMQNTNSFQLESEIKYTVNKNSESKITKPLFTFNDSVILFALDKAILAASDDGYEEIITEELITDESTAEEPVFTEDTATSSTTAPSTSSATNSQGSQAVTGSTSSLSDESEDQVNQSVTQENNESGSTSIKEFSSKAKAYFSKEGSTAELEITSESNKTSQVKLIDKNSKLYVNSTNIDFSGSSKNWVNFPISGREGELLSNTFSSPNLDGFSVTGNRLGSGKINGIPIYRYKVNVKIGSLLNNVGIKDEMINSIEGEIYISKKDQTLQYVELIIIPAISSSISRIDFKAILKDFNTQQEISIPSENTEVPSTATTVPSTTAPSTTPPTGSPSVSAELLARDAQRKTDLKSIETALKNYYQANGKYPNSYNQTVETRTKGNILSKTLVPEYLSSLPVDPWSDKYYYGYKSDGSSYEISALLGNNADTEGTMVGGKNLYIIKH